jgi:hypothetical protein
VSEEAFDVLITMDKTSAYSTMCCGWGLKYCLYRVTCKPFCRNHLELLAGNPPPCASARLL